MYTHLVTDQNHCQNSSNDPGEGGDDSSRMHQRNSSSGGSIAGLLRLDGTKALDLFVNAPQSTNTMGPTTNGGTFKMYKVEISVFWSTFTFIVVIIIIILFS